MRNILRWLQNSLKERSYIVVGLLVAIFSMGGIIAIHIVGYPIESPRLLTVYWIIAAIILSIYMAVAWKKLSRWR